jgi:DHA3 family macrolide efflux protein-like MFS transporter
MLTSMLGLMGMGVGTLMMAIAPPSALLMAVAAALCVGIMTPITMGPFYAVIQSVVEPDMQARIITLLSSVGGGMAPIGLMIAGPVADHAGIKTWFFLGGLLCVLMSVAGLFIPAVMNIENHQSRTLAKVEVEA